MSEIIPPSPQSQPLLSVYEIANTTRREIIVWIGNDGEDANGTVFEGLRPAHWAAADHIIMNTIGLGLRREDASFFQNNYAKNVSHLPGWDIRLFPPS